MPHARLRRILFADAWNLADGARRRIRQRFLALAALVRDQYSLHGRSADDHGFFADGGKLTLGARLQDGNGDCGWVLTPAMLTGDLDALARTFYTDICLGDKPDSWYRATDRRKRASQPAGDSAPA